MSLMAEINEGYLGYQITVRAGPELRANGYVAAAWVHTEGDQQVCNFTELVDFGAKGWPRDDQEASTKLAEQTFHRARGAILLDRARDLDGVKFSVPERPSYAQRGRDYIQRVVLIALERVIRLQPRDYGHVPFDDSGITLLEDIDPRELEYVLVRLQGAGLVEPWGAGGGPGNRRIRATHAGLSAADQLVVERNAPGLLLEETIARVENTLSKYDSELVESLRRQSLRVAQARELGEHEVGEVAQACEQIIWDFLDLDVLWEGVSGKRPPRGSTRDRLRLLLKARVPSQAEAELLEGLEQYIVGWFGPLEQFIHKYRKLPGESERAHAKRIVVYTYMLLGDLIEVLGL